MATIASSTDKSADLLQNLSLDPQPKTLEIPEPTEKTSVYQYGRVESGYSTNGQIQQSERSVTPFIPGFGDSNICYVPNGYSSTGFFYGSYDGTGNEWDEYSRYPSTDGVDMTSGVYGGNGSVMYHGSYGYAPYGPYSPVPSPVPALGNEGQLYGSQHYQYASYFPPLIPSSAPFTPSQPASSQGELSISTLSDQKTLPVETAKGNSNSAPNVGGAKENNGATPFKPSYQNTSHNLNNSCGRSSLPGGIPASGYQDPRFGFDGQYRSTGIISSYSKANNFPTSRNSNFRQNSNFMGCHQPAPVSGMGSTHGYVNRIYPNKFFGHYGNTFKSGIGFGSSGYDSRLNTHGWFAFDGKYKPKGRGDDYYGYRSDGIDGLNELNRGPRAKGFKNQKGVVPVTLAVKGQTIPPSETNSVEKDGISMIPDREQYNSPDFPDDYAHAKFFVIKSYSEDDVHKSIKYNVWASTPNGNKKLAAAYQEAQLISGGCPIFLFFSVNASGQFVGLAEMVGPVDFLKNVEYWQQDKWTGCFPVKWLIVKDVPNSLLKHITLENNENKPMTNSRDTQEVKLEQGLKVIKIFKDHSSKTCILDDFEFYEKRQKIVQERKAKQQQFQKEVHVLEEKASDDKKEVANGSIKSLDVVPDVITEPTSAAQSNGDVKHLHNGSVTKTGDASMVSKPVALEKRIIVNGIANGC